MKVTLINKSDSTGGAAVVSRRLLHALVNAGVDARMLVVEKRTSSPRVAVAAGRWAVRRAFLAERLKIFAGNGFDRARLFQVDTASDGLPLWRHEWVRDADVVCLNWVNQGMLSLRGIGRIAALGKPLVWTMHDMWCMTGVCHHAGGCRRFERECGSCPLLGRAAGDHDLSASTHRAKARLYGRVPIHFVAVSNWLAGRAATSTLLDGERVSVIPNAFHMPAVTAAELEGRRTADGLTHVVMGAARLDDPVKGLGILIDALRHLAAERPYLPPRLHLDLFGDLRDRSLLDRLAVPYTWHGPVYDAGRLRDLYLGAVAVLSPSLWETLPGTLVEGQAYGAIPVAFRSGGQGDIIDHLHTGYLAGSPHGEEAAVAARFAEGIRWAVEESHEGIGAAMRRSVEERFSAQSVARRYIDLFENLLDRRH